MTERSFILGFFDSLRSFFGFETRAEPSGEESEVIVETAESPLLTAVIGSTVVTRSTVLEIPTVKAALGLIKGAFRETPIKLYEKSKDGRINEVEGDKRVFLLNDEPGDTLSATQFWDAMIDDYFLSGGGYAYINWRGNEIESIHFVEDFNISILQNDDPIFKSYDILVQSKKYKPYQFLKILRDTKDGATGTGIVYENKMLLSTAFHTMKFEKNLVSTGGNKKGFITATKHIAKEAIEALKKAWKRLYSSSDENIVILNDGLTFKECSNTSVEMQLNESKQTNAAEIAKLFNIPLGMLSGTGTNAASEDDKKKFLDYCVLPFFKTVTNALNRDLLLESEKGKRFFDFDTKDIQKGSLLERFQAYQIAIKTNVMCVDECRKVENLPPIGQNFINLGLGSVMYNPETGKAMVPNTGEIFNMNKLLKKDAEAKEGEEGKVVKKENES